MKFDKIYRQANDDIPVNSELLAALKEQAKHIDTNPVTHVKKKPVFNIYRYGFIAAALVIGVAGANIFSSYMSSKNNIVQTPVNYIDHRNSQTSQEDSPAGITTQSSDVDTEAIAIEKQKSNQPDTTNNSVQEESAPENNDYSSQETSQTDTQNAANQQPDVSVSEDSVQESTDSYGDTPQTVEESPSTADTPSDYDEYLPPAAEDARICETDSTGGSAGGGGYGGGGGSVSGGGSASREESIYAKNAPSASSYDNAEADSVEEIYKSLSIEEYCSHFGFNISGIFLPGNMKQNRSGNAYIYTDTEGNVTNSGCTVFYSEGEKTVTLTFYTDAVYVKNISLSSGGTQISSNAAIKNFGDNLFAAYVYYSDKGYLLDTVGLSESEVALLATSLK